jgi:hypothetical protein
MEQLKFDPSAIALKEGINISIETIKISKEILQKILEENKPQIEEFTKMFSELHDTLIKSGIETLILTLKISGEILKKILRENKESIEEISKTFKEVGEEFKTIQFPNMPELKMNVSIKDFPLNSDVTIKS